MIYMQKVKKIKEVGHASCQHQSPEQTTKIIKTIFYRLWKLNDLMAKAKINAKSTVQATTIPATTPRKSRSNPKQLFTKSSTVCSVSMRSFISPNCETIKPYKVQATGHAQQYHVHHTGILCCWPNRLIETKRSQSMFCKSVN